MGYIKDLTDKIISVQSMIFGYVDKDDLVEGEGNIAELEVLGVNGERLRLKFDGSRIRYAENSEMPLHIIRMSEDTYLDLIDGDTDLGTELDLGHITFEGENWLYHATKWRQGFERIRGILRRLIGNKMGFSLGGG